MVDGGRDGQYASIEGRGRLNLNKLECYSWFCQLPKEDVVVHHLQNLSWMQPCVLAESFTVVILIELAGPVIASPAQHINANCV